MSKFQEFVKNGYANFDADRIDILDGVRDRIFQRAKELVPYKGEPIEEFFDKFHEYKLAGTELNQFRTSLIDFFFRQKDLTQKIFQSFESTIIGLVGNDVAGQKLTNFVIQQPGDRDQVPTHRDAPLNSNFEVVLWIPLTHSYGSKSMFVLDKDNSLSITKEFKAGKSYKEFCDYSEKHAKDLDVKYGQVSIIQTGLSHGCRVNVEGETRWTLNIRYKNLFSPYGSKGLAEFFQVVNLSPVAQVGFAFDKIERATHAAR